MGASKTDFFTAQQNELANLSKALGHPARVAIMEHLMKTEGCICGDIVDALPLAQPTISQHLKELKSAGLIKGNVEGNAICYCIDETGVQKIMNFLEGISHHIQLKKSDCC